ncbi:hypothetical protein [Marinobacterium aestuariivivens]|uniref:Apea-like HEPN domain-containing protein n=1 Tax=Marinobacterium aestuariivivens TaxID=1698799 RepID=A0ABW2A765_9GAMM
MSNSKHPLRPDETIHKILISTTSRMVGEFVSDEILICHAWQNFTNSSGTIRMEENPVSRSGFIIAFQTEPHNKESGIVIPDYSPVGEVVCSYLSVLFGKRFDCHGLVEGSGFYNTPDLLAYSSICNPKLPFNTHKQRGCFKIPLNLSSFSPLSKILTGSDIDPAFQSKLNAACKFYMQALQNVEYEPEVAYLHLITSGEILAGFFEYKKEEVLDQQILDVLNIIEGGLENGQKISRQLSNRLLGIKRSFVKSLCSLVDQRFFESRESEVEFGCFKPDFIERNIGAAYDLRSKYVHTGVPFGNWIQPRGHHTDLQCGRPVVSDKDFSKILEKAPTFLGLERFIRYCLLNFMASNGFPEIMECRDSA